MTNNRRYYRIAEITIQVDSDLPMNDTTFCDAIELFRVDGPGADTVRIWHHFQLPELCVQDLGKPLYRHPPWAVYRRGDSWIYLGILLHTDEATFHKVVVCNHDHTLAHIYNDRDTMYRAGNLPSLTIFATDQILIARLIADRHGLCLHSAGAILNGAGVLFVGQTGVGKSTTMRMLMEARVPGDPMGPLQVEILCDDRNIVRRWESERAGISRWRVYGTWSHGDVTVVSPSFAPLRAICFVEQADGNTVTPLTDRKEIVRRLLGCVVRPFVTADWWNKTMDVVEQISCEVPCYMMRFDLSGKIVGELRRLIHGEKE